MSATTLNCTNSRHRDWQRAPITRAMLPCIKAPFRSSEHSWRIALLAQEFDQARQTSIEWEELAPLATRYFR